MVLSLWLVPALAQAMSAEEALKKVDAANNPHENRKFTIKMTIREADGAARAVSINIAERGHGRQRIMLFTEPADVKGMGVLSQDRNTIYVYLPSYNKVRRVGMHARKQSFQGSDFSFDDMAQIRYADDYDPKILQEDEKKVLLELNPRAGKEGSTRSSSSKPIGRTGSATASSTSTRTARPRWRRAAPPRWRADSRFRRKSRWSTSGPSTRPRSRWETSSQIRG
jgi:outer membrane lipoprotein-sorting protein